MKSRLLALMLSVAASAWAAAPPKQPEYTINVHVSASRMVKHSESGYRYQQLDVTIDGKKYEVESLLPVGKLLMLGDYKARLITDEHSDGDPDIKQEYEFQFPDKKTREFLVIGQSE